MVPPPEYLVERSASTRAFVFANTVSARNYAGTNQCHGWIGIRRKREALRERQFVGSVKRRCVTPAQPAFLNTLLPVVASASNLFGLGGGRNEYRNSANAYSCSSL
jgi:hypothetical protein